jgi:hypothetical protein
MSNPEEIVEPIALTVKGKDEIAAFVCGKCRTVASSPRQYIGEDAVEVARVSGIWWPVTSLVLLGGAT